jgi:hypothetical protein
MLKTFVLSAEDRFGLSIAYIISDSRNFRSNIFTLSMWKQ